MKKDSKVLCFDKVISCDSKEIDWIKRDVEIKNEKGEVIFEQKDIEAPVKWSQTAVQIVASKYFREIDGVLENSIDDMVDRIVCEVGTWGIEQKYFKISDMPSQINFKEELRAILLNQMAAFNSPVYFSLGVKEKPQTSACFITSVDDTMDSIMELFATDAKIFKGGSGNGVNISRLRGKGEKLSTGGTSSGPVSFMDAMDVSAGAVKSGGALRRSSKLVCMDDDHPDILEFIQAKSKQEEMGHSLMECGYDGGLDGDIISTIRFQNANHSVRLSDEFFHAVENDKKWYTVNRKGGGEKEHSARDILLEIAKATWYTGDPGVQYSTTINNWNTCPNSGDIRSSNPCLAGDTLISTSEGDIRIKDLCEKPFKVVGGDGGLHEVPPAFCTGVKSVYRLKTKSGSSIDLTEGHRVSIFKRGDVAAKDLTKEDKLIGYCKRREFFYTDQFESLEYIGEEPVYNLTEKETHHYVANGLSVRNCSEFLFLDDSACNLASINLVKFWSLEKGFDLKKLEQTIRVMITAQDILIDGSSYPTEKIKLNSRIFRPLGLGFTNLGGLLMRMGIAYDSKEGRNVASFLTSFITGNAYLQSARLARVLGPFKMYEINKKYVNEVIKEHDEYNYTILEGKHYELSIIKDLWGRVIDEAGRNGMRNSQVTVIAPTGTISFMMDADTTGCEPEFSLVKYKKLVGGGTLKIVNESVEPGLRALGYYDRYVKEILDHVHENGTVEGSPIDPEHLSVFDCSLKSENGSRFISPLAHLEMLEAIQPYISGGISKTVNVQTDTTVDEIYDLYIEGYKMGLKSIAIYRDGSKITQPLSVKKKEKKNLPVEKEEKNLKRRRLSSERGSITHKFNIGGSSGYITAGLFDNGELGEIFINVNKAGSTIGGLLDSFAILTSISLQHGVELEVLVKKFEGTRFLPDGWTGNQDIPVASSILDYVFRWLKAKFLSEKELKESLPAKQTDVFVESENPSCAFCSGSTIRSGTCFVCETCGSTTGCG
jgi:ribonucleotide reductase alpha subunit